MTASNYEFRLAMIANSDIPVCKDPLPANWANRFHLGDRIRMRPTRIVAAEYSPIPSGCYGTLVSAHTNDVGLMFGDSNNRATRPLEIEWNIEHLNSTPAHWFPVGLLRQAVDLGYPFQPDQRLCTIRWYMHPCHVHITHHNKTGYSVARLFAETLKWTQYAPEDNRVFAFTGK